MTEYTAKYLLKHNKEFGICEFCSIVVLRTANKCWLCKKSITKGLRDITQGDLLHFVN